VSGEVLWNAWPVYGRIITEPEPPTEDCPYATATVETGEDVLWHAWPIPPGLTIGDRTPMEWDYPGKNDPEVNAWYRDLLAKEVATHRLLTEDVFAQPPRTDPRNLWWIAVLTLIAGFVLGAMVGAWLR
jgi:hypothetical protein